MCVYMHDEGSPCQRANATLIISILSSTDATGGSARLVMLIIGISGGNSNLNLQQLFRSLFSFIHEGQKNFACL